VRWPASLLPALTTGGFRGELRELLLRATERGVDPELLAAWSRETGNEAWLHAAAFQEQYEAVTAFSTAGGGDASGYDPAELVRAAIAELEDDPALLRAERERARWLFVDEYQDTDPAQVELLQLLAGGGADLVVVGDPDQAVYTFRGAEPRGIVEFPERFRTVSGRPAPRLSLGVCRRSGPALLDVSRRVAEALPGPWSTAGWPLSEGAEEGAARGARVRLGVGRGRLRRRHLRRAHLVDGVPWSGMAVVVRTALAIGPLRRALTSAGVPVEVGTDDLPLAAQPGRRAAAGRARALLPRPGAEPGTLALDEPGAEALLTSALGGATVLDLRRLRRAVRIGAGPARDRRRRAGRAAGHRAHRRGAAGGAARSRRPPARRVAAVLAAGRVALARDGPRGRAVGDVAAQWPGRPVGAGQRRRRGGRSGRRPRPRRRRRALRRRGRLRRPAALGHRRPRSSSTCRHRSCPGRRGGPGVGDRRRPAAHRARLQGPGVGRRLRGRRAGGHLARPARPRHAAGTELLVERVAGIDGAVSTGACRCWPRSGGCSTSPAPAPAAGWW
jgi:hypothetical protein